MFDLIKCFFLFVVSVGCPPLGGFLVVHYFNKCKRYELEKEFDDEAL